MSPAGRISAAVELLDAIFAQPDKPADAVASAFFRARRYIGAADRRAVSERVWTCLRTWRRVGWWLGDPCAAPRLRVAATLVLEGTPVASLERLFSGEPYCASQLSIEERSRLAKLEGQVFDHVAMPNAVRLEVPDFVLAHLADYFGVALEPEIIALIRSAPLDLRVNLLKATREEACAHLAMEGFVTKTTPFSPWGLRTDIRQPITATRAFRSGVVEIQDEGSQLVALLVGAAPGMRVVDWCAGAGGKTLAMAMTMRNCGQIIACDIAASRLLGAVRRLRRAGVHNVERHLIEANGKWLKRRVGSFHRVLVDAPCTGTGTWRRSPDARLRLTPRVLGELLVKQATILDSAQALVRRGGRLVYATCSLLPQENEAQVASFLARHRDFSIVPLARVWPLKTPPPCDGNFLSLTPARHGTDGFFAAVLEREA